MVCDVLEAEGRAVAELIGADAARFQRLDVGDPAGWKAAVAAVLDWRGRLDILVNNAGIIDRSTIMGMGLESWNRVLGVNLTGAFLGIKAAAPAMRDGGGGGASSTSPPMPASARIPTRPTRRASGRCAG